MEHKRDGYFDFERLDAYRLARMALEFVVERRRRLAGLPGRSGEQLEASHCWRADELVLGRFGTGRGTELSR
jgi:hypothetical protein